MPRSQPASAPPAAPLALATRLGYLLKHAQLRYQSLQYPALNPMGLDGRLLAVLVLVAGEGPALQQRISARLKVDRTTMVGLIDALEERGFVERRRDPADRRGHVVAITDAGETMLANGLRAADGVEDEFLASLSVSERRQFVELLVKVVTQRDA